MLYFTFVFHTSTRFPFRRLHYFSPIPPSHTGQSLSAGCPWHTACQVHLCLVNGTLKQTQLKSLSINVVALASFYPKAKTFRPVHSSVFECLYSCSAILQNERHKASSPFHKHCLIQALKEQTYLLSCQEYNNTTLMFVLYAKFKARTGLS